MKKRDSIKLIKGVIQSKLDGTPYKLNFAITSACNSHCITCNVWKIYRENPKISERDLNIDQINKFFSKLPKSISWISFSGGEPFLRNDLYEIITSAINHLPNLVFISMPTNGLARKRIISFCKKLFTIKHPSFHLYFSIDGPEKIHDKIRGVKDGFNKTWHTYMTVKKLASKLDHNFHPGIETTISVHNVDYLKSFFRKIKASGHESTITIAHNAYLYHNESDLELTPQFEEKTKEILKFLEGFQKFYSPQHLIERIYIKKAKEFLKMRRKMVLSCASMTGTVAVSPNGDVTPCFMWGIKLGNLSSYGYDIKKILASKKAREVRELIRSEKCPVCWTPCEAVQTIINNLPKSLF